VGLAAALVIGIFGIRSLTSNDRSAQHPLAEPPSVSVPVHFELCPTLSFQENAVGGVQYRIERTGTYKFEYLDGTFSAWPGDQGPWETTIVAFRGSSPIRDGSALSRGQQLFALGDLGKIGSKEEALSRAKNSPTSYQVALNAGDIVTLVAVDDDWAYNDNPGSVTVRVSPRRSVVQRVAKRFLFPFTSNLCPTLSFQEMPSVACNIESSEPEPTNSNTSTVPFQRGPATKDHGKRQSLPSRFFPNSRRIGIESRTAAVRLR
jgi:hypothetical protein